MSTAYLFAIPTSPSYLLLGATFGGLFAIIVLLFILPISLFGAERCPRLPTNHLKSLHFDSIDGLRALAITLIVWYHYWQLSFLGVEIKLSWITFNFDWIPAYGFVGVELFLFVSALCLSLPYASAFIDGGISPTLCHYIYKRFIKIIPSYILAIIFFLLIRNEIRSGELIWHLFRHLTFTHNWSADTYGSIGGVFWTLGVEIQFYVTLPFLIFYFCRFPIPTYLMMICLGYSWRIFGIYCLSGNFQIWRDQMPGFMDIFANGMMAAWMIIKVRNCRDRFCLRYHFIFLLMGLSGIVALFALIHWGSENRFVEHSIETWKIFCRGWFGLLLVFCAVGFTFTWQGTRFLVANRVMVYISTISYNLYLWHQFIAFEFLKRQIPKATTSDPHADHLWQVRYFLLVTLVSLAVASLITYLFERPLLKWGFKGVWKRLKARVQIKHL